MSPPPRRPPSDPPTPPEGFRALSALRLRLWIGGELRDELWINADDPNAGELTEVTSAYHLRITEMAEAAGVPWMTEVYDPASPPERAYLRIGTDRAGMSAGARPWHGEIPWANGESPS